MNEAAVLPAAFARRVRLTAAAEALVAQEALAPKRPRRTPDTSANDNHSRARKKPRRDRPKAGKLEGIANLPLDILFEIFGHLNPADLLHLARVNKYLRATLLRKDWKPLWEISVRGYRTPIPPCLDERLELPQYVNLLFGQHCFLAKCPDAAARRKREAEIREQTSRVLKFVEEVTKFLAAEAEYDRRGRKRVLDQQCNLYALDLCVAETYGLKAQHSIRDQLQKMGYGEELEKLGKNSLSLEKFVKRATHELNDQTWPRIKPKVVEELKRLILDRKKHTAVDTFKRRVKALEQRLFGAWGHAELVWPAPRWSEIAIKEPVRTLLMQDLESEEVDLLPMITDKELVRLGQECVAAKIAFFGSLLPVSARRRCESTASAQEVVLDDRFFLATTWFRCTSPRCTEPMPFARAVTHNCLFVEEAGLEEGNTHINLSAMFATYKARTELFYHPGFVGQPIYVDEGARHHAKVLIAACGLSPDTATFGDMEATRITLVCTTCGHEHSAGMDWRDAVGATTYFSLGAALIPRLQFLHSVHRHPATYELTDIRVQWLVIRDSERLEAIRRKQIEAIEGGHREPQGPAARSRFLAA
ncbi:uncharacterized protein SCHCODRAFT_01178579 [Schizophyllum commune H4-8]|uniref:F-box domain-containing protein n=1 Tax=Schizophyllum commune (strain H4-8 / FGSC 9210) TaxID=578458 RepID=D8PLU2_SCHCM|nr:uncharacterized protein SCHCODRAFT_01178579 [Schizophyllum commune H4-8]KAI5897346.1 hypothetical protein SCHCODRAFT_01178579 [Schizophyllum commune H4-8]